MKLTIQHTSLKIQHHVKSSCSDLISKKFEKVDSIYDELESKHYGSYSKEQLRMWAHMVQMGKWSRYKNPPMNCFSKG